PNYERMEALLENSREFKKIWQHKAIYGSMSDYDAALARYASEALWTDQEIANLLICHRRKWDPEKIEKPLRQDYVRGTLALVRGDRGRTDALMSLCAAAEAPYPVAEEVAAERPAPSSATLRADADISSSDDRATILGKLSKVFGVEVARWLQFGEEEPIYTLVLADGRAVRIGSAHDVINGDAKFRAGILAACRVMMPPVPRKLWARVCQALTKIVEVDASPDSTEVVAVRSLLELYLERELSHHERNRDIACAERIPWIEDGEINLSIESLLQWVARHRPEKWRRRDLLNALKSAGFRYRVVAYSLSEHRRSSRSVWAASMEKLGLYAPENV
ncbi:MAG: hypothetical protein KGL39_35545, partial [Patescibacteria group bacterium]|nr:hypothetical protein [Patescibacteria group bacterium]